MPLIPEQITGKPPGTYLYINDETGQAYLITAPPFRSDTTIFLAAVEYSQVRDLIPNNPDDLSEGYRRVGVDAKVHSVTAIDADGDPLNGLTPLHTLPAGTTHEQAVAYLEETT